MTLTQAQYFQREIDEAYRIWKDFEDKGFPDSAEMWQHTYFVLVRVRDRIMDLSIARN